MADLQELVDDLAAELGRPISVEDRRFRLLAHSSHTGELDRVRRETILTREAPADVREWLESLGLLRAVGVVETPDNAAVGMTRRTCLPVRHADVLLGFVWVVLGERPLSPTELGALERTAAVVETELWQRRTATDAHQHLVRALLFDADVVAAQHASLELAALLRCAEDAPVVVAVGVAGEEAGEAVRRRWRAGGATWATHGRLVVVLAAGLDAGGLAQALTAAGAPHAGAAASAPGLTSARDAYREAALTLHVLQRAPGFGPWAAWPDLGGWGVVADLWDRAGRPAPPAVVAPLRHHPELLEAAEAAVEAAGDLSAAAEDIHVHRATLYRRLARIKDLTSLDVHTGDDRLTLQLALRLTRLAS